MNYKSVYDNLIVKAKKRGCPDGYYEKHHIIPKSLGGTDSESNMVNLTAKEHLFAHKLLFKFSEGDDKAKMQVAYFFMFYSNNSKRSYSTSDLAYAREQCSLAKKGRTAHNKGKKMNLSPEVRKKLKETGTRNLRGVDNTGMVVCKHRVTGEMSRVTCEEYHRRPELTSTRGLLDHEEPKPKKKRPKKAKEDWKVRVMPKFSEYMEPERRKASFGRKGKNNGCSRESEIIKYGKMTDDEFSDYCEGKTQMRIKRVTTIRNRYLQKLEDVTIE